MSSFLRHILLPAVMPALFLTAVANPGNELDCRTRGLVAAAIAFVSVLAGLASAVKAVKGRIRGDRDSHLWVISSLILSMPAAVFILLA